MKMRAVTQIMLLCISFALIAGCASTPVAGDATPGNVFQHPIERVQKAAAGALVATGFEITKQQPTYVEGYRPRKVVLLSGSGGETAGVWLTAQGPNATRVKVDTARSLAGFVGQKNWDAEILSEMTKRLSEE